MGNNVSYTKHDINGNIFAEELNIIKEVVNKIIDDKDMFLNKDYNFLSKDVCNEHYVLLEQELNKHLKIELESLGTSLYIIPKSHNDDKLTKLNLTKKKICQKVTNHYIKILYIICLIKYVYNLENNGDMSIAGIIFRNIKILDDIMEISFCQIPHKNYQNNGKNITKINLGLLEGITFFTEYFLQPEEANVFIGLMKTILSRKKQSVLTAQICDFAKSKSISQKELIEIEKLYKNRYNKNIICVPNNVKSHVKVGGESIIDEDIKEEKRIKINLNVFIEKENPIFVSKMCYASNQIIVKLNTPDGKKLVAIYNKMKSNYDTNIKDIQSILDMIVMKEHDEYILKDIKQDELSNIIECVKINIKKFYMQSILDYHLLLDTAKNIPNISLDSSNKI